MTEELRKELEHTIFMIASENNFIPELMTGYLSLEDLRTILHEINSRIRLRIKPFDQFKYATIVITEGGDAILNLYREILEETPEYIYGYGYAYNIYYPQFSEWGYLYTPRRR